MVLVSNPDNLVRVFLSFLLISVMAPLFGQPFLSQSDIVSRVSPGGSFPEKLLSTRSVVIHSPQFSEDELKKMQEYFQRAGVDAVTYFPSDVPLAGLDAMKAFNDLLVKREISNIILAEKTEGQYRITVTTFCGNANLIEKGQPGWQSTDPLLLEILKQLLREAAASLKRSNLLVNIVPETDGAIDIIVGKRNEFYAVDMKVDMVAIPKFGDEQSDAELAEIVAKDFPFKYQMTAAGTSERELRKQGYLYVLCFIRSRGKVARELLGYNPSKAESAIVSVTFPEGQPQLKNIPSGTTVVKAYFKHIDSGNIFLGNKWDADVTWQQALQNNLRAMKAEIIRN